MTGELTHRSRSQGQNDQTGVTVSNPPPVISDELWRVFRSSGEGEDTQIKNCFNTPDNSIPEVTLDTKAAERQGATLNKGDPCLEAHLWFAPFTVHCLCYTFTMGVFSACINAHCSALAAFLFYFRGGTTNSSSSL